MPQPYSTLANIYTKVRRLTRSPSTDQLSDDDLNDYINNFVLYDLPEHLRLFNLRGIVEFYTAANVQFYDTVDLPVTDPLFNFKNKYITIHEPVYVAGFRRYFTQSREQFYNIWPQIESIQTFAVGNNINNNFVGFVTGYPIQPYSVSFNSVDALNNTLVMADLPSTDQPNVIGNLIVPTNSPVAAPAGEKNFINYLTGQFQVTFSNKNNIATAPGAGANVNSQSVPYAAGIPQAVLYYDDKFWFRPIPDQAYKVTLEMYVRPTELLSTNTAQTPELDQWWQYIAYGAAVKVFQDRMDLDSVAMLMPEFKNQQNLVNRCTIVQLTNQRTSTIFTEGSGNYPYGGWGFFGSQY
jgi:hypothetical protein